MHIDFALPVNHDLLAGYAEWKNKAKVACADYGEIYIERCLSVCQLSLLNPVCVVGS